MPVRLLIALALLAGCSSSTPDAPVSTPPPRASAPATATPTGDEAVAYLAGGCFWGVEHFLERIDGVIAVQSGYMGGHVDAPTYEQVSSHASGHVETVRVRYDPAKVDYEAIAKRFFEIHDPTQADGQGPDLGPQYLSIVFYADDAQKRVAQQLVARLVDRGYAVATELRPAAQFWLAEDYHQDYYAKTGKTPYCHVPVDRFGDGP